MRYLLIIIFFMVSGCAQMIPARSKEISPGVYQLESSGNIFASLDTLQKLIDKKATKLCGDAGYKYVNVGDLKLNKQVTYTNGVRTEASYQVLTKTAKCNDSPQ